MILNALVTALLLVSNAQVPRDRPATPTAPPAGPTGTASISGTVVAADDGHPLALANVVVIGGMTGTLKMTSTDRNGQYAFANLAADRYTVAASKPPFIGAVAGAKRPARPGTPLVVANGQKLAGVTIRLPRGAVIAGTIFDEHGQAAANAGVILQQWKIRGDERVLGVPAGTGSVFTDVEGRYRFYGVPPGEYLVAAMRTNAVPLRVLTNAEADQLAAGRSVDLTTDNTLRSAPIYFPGTPRASDAAPVIVNPGDERAGVDIRVDYVRAAKIDGTVYGPDGQPMPNVTVVLGTVNGSSPSQTMMTARTGADGRFTTQPSIPGLQILTAMNNVATTSLFAYMQVDTTLGDQTGLQITMRPPMTMLGRLQFEGVSKPSPANRFVPFNVLGRTGMAFGGVGATAASETGDFQFIRVVPGRYVIGGPMSFGATDATIRWSLKSVIADDKDITDLPLEISDTVPKLVVITSSDQWQQLSGKLSHQSGGPATDETVIVFPADRAYWYQGSRRIAITRPGSDGLFSFGGPGPTTLPPGEYLLAAVTDLGREEQFDPSFLAALVPAAAPITIGPGEKKTQDLVIR